MDSLTQITLGAAVGEAVAGKKIGNRAMLWGAIAGTIPDLDVFIGNIFMDDLHALAFHRGITHSIFFSIGFPFVLMWLVQKIYATDHYQGKIHKNLSFFTGVLLLLGVSLLISSVPYLLAGMVNPWVIGICLLLAFIVINRMYRNYYLKVPLDPVEMNWKHWYIFFFLTLITHPLLDCCTTYGTQIWQPFSNIRISWNNISVFDPFYTAPFLLFVILASLFTKKQIRMVLNGMGITISMIYMLWTVSNKLEVNKVFNETLNESGIPYNRMLTTPTIGNNFLWSCIAESDSTYYAGFYSLLDTTPGVKQIAEIPKNDHLIRGFEEDESIRMLRWFSDGFHAYSSLGPGKILVRDMRFGRFDPERMDPDGYVFKFILEQNADKSWRMIGEDARPQIDFDTWFSGYIRRIKGI